MYDFPANLDLKQFRGKTLGLVSFAQYKIDFHFSGGYVIGVEDAISVNTPEPMDIPTGLPLIYPLINQEVTSVVVKGVATLVFEFERGDRLYIHDSSQQYECYQIQHNGEILAII